MSKESPVTSQKKKDTSRLTILISVLAIAVLFIVDLYIMINYSGKFIILAFITVLMLVWVYFLFNAIFAQVNAGRENNKEQFESIFRAQKANYLLQKKLVEQMEFISDSVKTPSEDIITAQKAIAKVTISRNKENTEALMNSNDQVMEKMFQLEGRLEENNTAILDQQKGIIDEAIKDMLEKQQKVIDDLGNIRTSIKSELTYAVDQIKEQIDNIESESVSRPVIEKMPTPDETVQFDREEPMVETSLEEMPLLDESPLEDLSLMDDISPLEEIPSLDDISMKDELSLEEPFGEIPLGEEIFTDENSSIDEILSEEPEEIPETAPVIEPEPEPIPEPEPAEPMPDMSNPNKIMSPDEIAALIANL